MKRSRLHIFLFIFILISLFPKVAYSNSAEPPTINILVINAPKDLKVYIKNNERENQLNILYRDDKAWESFFKSYRNETNFDITQDHKDLALVVENNGEKTSYNFPDEVYKTYNNYLTLNLKNNHLYFGQPIWRMPLLVSLRLILTLLIEGLIFYIFGYRQRASWIRFLIINLLTQGALNISIAGSNGGSYAMVLFIFAEVIILIVESIFLMTSIREHSKWRSLGFSIIANAMSLVLGGYIILNLPI